MTSRAGEAANLKCCRCALAEGSEWVRLRRRHSPEQVLGVQRFESILRELAAALGGVNLFTCKLLELFHGHHDGLAVPVFGQQITGVSVEMWTLLRQFPWQADNNK